MSWPLAVLVALAVDALISWPDWLYRRIGHPVTWMGALISWLEKRLNRDVLSNARRFGNGLLTTLIVVGATGACTVVASLALPDTWLGTLLGGLLMWPLVATRSMYQHVAAVADPLERGDITGARQAVSMIVGRDPASLDGPGVARAALESLAENASDGITAPVLWGALLGLPGIAMYKAINTLDSMIGHRSARYEWFGKAAARIDDLVNLPAARLTAVLFALTSPRPWRSLRVMMRDAGQHRSPNAGWPEAALAAALHVRLSGPRVYDDRIAQEPYVNAEAPDPQPAALRAGLAGFVRAMLALAGAVALFALV